jgi:hypothetical protein
MTLSPKILFSFFLKLLNIVSLKKKQDSFFIYISYIEQLIKDQFHSVLNEKEKEFPFHLNDSVFQINP